jgi:hypothetical protein
MNKWFRLVPAFDLECPDCNRRLRIQIMTAIKNMYYRRSWDRHKTGKKITKLLDTSGKNETYVEKVRKKYTNRG